MLTILSHFHNEELMLEKWVRHHLPLADRCIMVNHRSTDRSVEIIKTLAPHWEVVDTELEKFAADSLDAEMMKLESQVHNSFKICLNSTEFIWDPNFKETLTRVAKAFPHIQAFGMRSIIMVDKKETPVTEEPFWLNRHYGFVDGGEQNEMGNHIRRWRYVHNQPTGQYHLGRHGTYLSSQMNMLGMFLLWNGYSPWKQCKERKLQIRKQMPQWDIDNRLGFEHLMSSEDLDLKYLEYLQASKSLLKSEAFKSQYDLYYKKYIEGTY